MEAQDGGAGEEQVRENVMRPTPRTDAFERARQKFSGEPDALTVEYARALERDLAEAVEIASWLN